MEKPEKLDEEFRESIRQLLKKQTEAEAAAHAALRALYRTPRMTMREAFNSGDKDIRAEKILQLVMRAATCNVVAASVGLVITLYLYADSLAAR